MKKNILIILICSIAMQSYGQEKNFTVRGYISPGICKVSTQHRIFNDGKATLTNLTKSRGLFFGGGIEVLRKLEKNWLLGGNLGFVSKGYFATRDTTYNNGSFGGTGFERTDLNFLETTLLIEKQILLRDPNYKIIFSSGLFYGLHIPNIVGFGLEAKGNDFGTSISLGVQRKRSFAVLSLKKGLINIKNNAKSSFRTSIVSFNIGYSIL